MFPYSFAIELTCFAFAFFFFRKAKAMPWKLFPWFILSTALLDGTGWLLGIFDKPNQWLYNAVFVMFTAFIIWTLYHMYQLLSKSRTWLIVLLAIFYASFIIESFY